MKYALGSLVIDRDAALTALVQQVPLLSPAAMSRRLREFQSAGTVDLLSILDPLDADRPWLQAVLATTQQLRREGRHLALLDCEWRSSNWGGSPSRSDDPRSDDGAECAVALVDRSLTDAVRPGDIVQAGVAILRTPELGLVAMPRLFRKLCSNGAVFDLGCATGREIEPFEIETAMRACLQPGGFEATVGRLRWAAHEVVTEGAELVAAARPHSGSDSLLSRWRQQGDRSLWGLINAATSLAHADTSWCKRLGRERDAERLLCAGLERGSETAAAIATLR